MKEGNTYCYKYVHSKRVNMVTREESLIYKEIESNNRKLM